MQKGIVRMMGIGEEIINLSPAPKVGVLLVNPRKALSTAEVFSAVKEKNNSGLNLQGSGEKSLNSWFDWINSMRNDLTASAIDLIPDIRFILDKLITCDGARVVRMSGSGATCFALFEDFDLLQDAKLKIMKEFPSFWCESGELI
jgi:4-diphosphocytidyl-2-C-methyl-D-erythritol kinase